LLAQRQIKDSRERDDDEVEPVPSIAQEREVGQDESSSQDLRQTFGRVDRRENFPAPRTSSAGGRP